MYLLQVIFYVVLLTKGTVFLFIYLIIEVQRVYFCGNIKFILYIRSWLDKEEFLEQGNAFSDANILKCLLW